MHRIAARRGTPSECLLLAGGFSAGRPDLRLLSGDASSICNFNIGFAARLVVVCYLLCSAEFAIRQRHYSASLQLALSLCDKRLCAIFFSAVGITNSHFFSQPNCKFGRTLGIFTKLNSCVPLVASERDFFQRWELQIPYFFSQPNSEIRLNGGVLVVSDQ